MYRLLQRMAEQAAERISRHYGAEVVEAVGIRRDPSEIGEGWVKMGGARIVYRTPDIETAKKIRDLHHSSGFKYSRIVPGEKDYQVICETTENMTIPGGALPNNPGIRIIRILLFLRTMKRLKMLLRNTKF